MIALLPHIALVLAVAVALALVITNAPAKRGSLHMQFDKAPRDDVISRMAETIVSRLRETDECSIDDLARAGFSTAQILSYRTEAYALAARTLRHEPLFLRGALQ